VKSRPSSIGGVHGHMIESMYCNTIKPLQCVNWSAVMLRKHK